MTQRNTIQKFVPYIASIFLEKTQFRFFYATPEAQEWYDPLKPYARLEYDWVLENVSFEGRNFIDAGTHHGQYALVVGSAFSDCHIICVDALQENIDIAEVNLKLNSLEAKLIKCVVCDKKGKIRFSDPDSLEGSNGCIVEADGQIMHGERLPEIFADAHVVKLDIEGEEFNIIPNQIDEMKQTDTWIVEVHPFAHQAHGRHPDSLIQEFSRRGYTVLWVNRQDNRVEPYKPGTSWDIHSTVFAVKN